jgi:hypothetical protein
MGTLGVIVSRDGRRIVNGAEDGKITTWDVERKIIGVLSRLILHRDCLVQSGQYQTTSAVLGQVESFSLA